MIVGRKKEIELLGLQHTKVFLEMLQEGVRHLPEGEC